MGVGPVVQVAVVALGPTLWCIGYSETAGVLDDVEIERSLDVFLPLLFVVEYEEFDLFFVIAKEHWLNYNDLKKSAIS